MNILLTGEKGYVASYLAEYIGLKCERYILLQKSLRSNSVDSLSLNKIDIVIHAAALVHKKETPQSEDAYLEINTHLTYKLALKSKQAGVKQFIF